ncbi:MAG: hypothetical protein B7Z51_03465 [Methyloversatilis sp. 12-65-5]|nr:MAG: hypothetical protein B7Z51_03465 [Methyloversatilis sp. 12-65-5]
MPSQMHPARFRNAGIAVIAEVIRRTRSAARQGFSSQRGVREPGDSERMRVQSDEPVRKLKKAAD